MIAITQWKKNLQVISGIPIVSNFLHKTYPLAHDDNREILENKNQQLQVMQEYVQVPVHQLEGALFNEWLKGATVKVTSAIAGRSGSLRDNQKEFGRRTIEAFKSYNFSDPKDHRIK